MLTICTKIKRITSITFKSLEDTKLTIIIINQIIFTFIFIFTTEQRKKFTKTTSQKTTAHLSQKQTKEDDSEDATRGEDDNLKEDSNNPVSSENMVMTGKAGGSCQITALCIFEVEVQSVCVGVNNNKGGAEHVSLVLNLYDLLTLHLFLLLSLTGQIGRTRSCLCLCLFNAKPV